MNSANAKFSLVVQSGPSTSGAQAALFFARAILQTGHQLSQVFFQGDGVYCANHLLSPLSDQLNIYQEWLALHAKQAFNLHVCISSALKRGILDSHEAFSHGYTQYTLNKPFELVGLGQLAMAYRQHNKVIYFGR